MSFGAWLIVVSCAWFIPLRSEAVPRSSKLHRAGREDSPARAVERQVATLKGLFSEEPDSSPRCPPLTRSGWCFSDPYTCRSIQPDIELAESFEQRGILRAAAEGYGTACKYGSGRACWRAAEIYGRGDGIQRDWGLASKLFYLACAAYQPAPECATEAR